MKTRYILIAFAILLASACTKDSDQPARGERQLTITAWHEDSQGTRSAVVDGGTKVYWEPGDAIKVFSSEEANRFEAQCSGLVDVASFVGSLNIIGGANEGAVYDNHIWGLYPYRLDATCDGESVTTTLPSNQNGAAGTFAQSTFITLAHSDSFGLAFYNVCGGIRFSLTKSGIKRVVLESLGGEAIAGTFKTSFQNGVPVVQEVSEPATSITLKAPGDAFETGVWYYIVALPGTLSGGYKLTFRSEEGVGTLTCSNPVTIKRGIFGSLANVDSGVEFSAGGDDPEAINIEIDGEFWDWAAVPGGLSSTGNYQAFKAAADANYIYLYSKRKWHDELWKDSSGGYFYYEFDTDNNPATGTNDVNGNTGYGVEYWMYLYLFTGSSASPTFANSPKGSGYPSSGVIANILASGATDRTVIEVELRIPRANLGLTNPGTIRIYSWGNKSASNLKSSSSYISLALN
jgi:hypothetical protein